MKLLGCLALIFTSLNSFAQIQSQFRGPVQLKVWKHWQQSWNVEDVTSQAHTFELTRGTRNQEAYVQLKIRKNSSEASVAHLRCSALVRAREWKVEPSDGKTYESTGQIQDDWMVYDFPAANECLDSQGQRIVTEISVEASSNDQNIFSYKLKPMYVRGKFNSYWNNPIDPHSAHAGKGEVSVSTSMSGESGWDKWNNVLVRPMLNFVDRNTMSAGSNIGLHRHEANQELYFVESGSAVMVAGVATKVGENYSVRRQWDSQGSMQTTEEFRADGGWIEERHMAPGEISVIVPSSNDSSTVYFHGIRANEDTVFWTMGSKN